jgi:hypothetical protein
LARGKKAGRGRLHRRGRDFPIDFFLDADCPQDPGGNGDTGMAIGSNAKSAGQRFDRILPGAYAGGRTHGGRHAPELAGEIGPAEYVPKVLVIHSVSAG